MPTFKQIGFYVDQSNCTGCKACQIACKDKHDNPVGVSWRRVAEYTGGSNETDTADGSFRTNVFTYYTSMACNHCADPICVEVCPSTAMHKGENGIVSVDPDICIGCRYCEMACPYSAPQFDAAKGVMTKCDFCADFLAEGRDPACVASCPSRVLDYGEIDDLRAKYGTESGIEPLPDPSITRPNLVITPHRDAQGSGHGTGAVANPEEI
ncbi:dimethylsulfoxide reductase, chain B [Humibacillus sp. DSM 29435]|uniref:DMSO/selenate family reductase complex B subunit n=1 Tax=Humibacillus sp. DSM 29435 TaxID=1869167 RepID=UPI0008721492|nr:DMSO/selenate family reductase complex B subunit [Humibacillus sp. DSM 29435]OFE18802.1 dimethylsulfoxide reductase, chain B [Humibacillus sp. DSM 29435]